VRHVAGKAFLRGDTQHRRRSGRSSSIYATDRADSGSFAKENVDG
jgi:hypothetical protein